MNHPPPPAQAPPDPLSLLQAVGLPLVHVRGPGLVVWANAAAQQALAASPGLHFEHLWQGALPHEPAGDERQAVTDGTWYRLQPTALADGSLLYTLHPAQALHQARAELARERACLDLAREFGRMGFWERDVRTLEGQWDSEVLRFWGLEPGEATPEHHEAIRNILAEDRETLGNVFTDSIRQAGRYSVRFRVCGHDGRVRRIHSQWLVKNGDDGQPERVMGLMMDDTEPYALAQAAQELSSQLALAMAVSGIVIWRHDLASGRMHYSDAGWARLGLPPRPEGLTLDEVRQLIHPEDLPAVLASAEAALRSPEPVDVQARYRHVSGAWRPQLLRRTVLRDDQGRPRAFLGVALDMTERLAERLESAQALQSAEERVALAVRGMGLGTWEMDLETGRAQWDAQMWRLRGHVPQPRAMDVEERWACVHPEDRDRLRGWLTAALSSEGNYEHQFRVVWPDGQVRWLASRSATVVDREGRSRRIGLNWDVTDSRSAETARREAEAAQRESEAKSRFMARMSHELRTPLNAVLGFSTLLRVNETGIDEESRVRLQRLTHVISAGQHLLSLINDVLQLSALTGGEVAIEAAALPLQPLVEGAVSLLGPELGRLGVPVRLGALDALVWADATRLRQVMLNLLSNAIKYNRPGGEVRVWADRLGDRVLLRVQDDGRGLDPAQCARLFEPFNRLGAEREGIEGTGIGLAIVKALVERMNGQVRVHSQPGVGSTFEVELPAAQRDDRPAAAPAQAAPPSVPVAARTHRPCLLVVEDNPVNALIVSEMLSAREDLDFHLATDGAHALRLAGTLQPDLVLLDMHLPDFDGHEVLRRLRADPATAGIPCIAVSANAMPADIERALQAGMAAYWTKPLNHAAFMAALDARFGLARG